ncbi:AAA family ATPase [Acinetobacter baumannii]|uniref:AAA family ATPase n=1 Tax=Acinetobacter baumannii TaxID=470 RepID=UPI0009416231|nr:AAA family ATPase [Acinetobacter baumannii]
MALPIITADQTLLVQAIIVYLYADPGLGKSSMGFTAEKAISFDQDLAPYKTVVIDTVGAMLECIKTHLLLTANNRQKDGSLKLKAQGLANQTFKQYINTLISLGKEKDGSLKLKAQGLANQTFKQYINTLISLGKDVVFIAHASEDQNGDQIIYRPDLGGKNRNELYRIADVMGYLTTVTTGEGKNARVINFKPSPTHHAKNSGALGGETGEVWVPDLKAHPTFLADLITQAKDHINTLTPAQLAAAKAQEELENWKQSCEEAEHAGDLNQLTESLDKEHMYYQNMRQAMLMRAKALNCTFDKQRGTWISPPEFNGISDQQRDELQNFIAERGLDVKTVCEHLGIDALIQIEAAKLKAVKQDIETLAKTGMTA